MKILNLCPGRGAAGALALVLAVTPVGAGCSLMFVDGPQPNGPRTYQAACTTSNAWPTVDVLLAGFQAVRTVTAISHSEADYQGMALSRSSDIGFGVALLALTSISAGVGFSRVSDCKESLAPWTPPPGRRVRVTRRPAPPPAETETEPEEAAPPAAGVPSSPADSGSPPGRTLPPPPARSGPPPAQQETDSE